MDPALTPSMALCFFGITDDSVSHPSDSIRRSLCCVWDCGCGVLEEDGAVAAGDDIAAAPEEGRIREEGGTEVDVGWAGDLAKRWHVGWRDFIWLEETPVAFQFRKSRSTGRAGAVWPALGLGRPRAVAVGGIGGGGRQ
jgi:hypothetical protein